MQEKQYGRFIAKDMNNRRIEDNGLLRDIEKYFECQLTDEEEYRLRQRLSVKSLDLPEVREEKAVMGFRGMRMSDSSYKLMPRKPKGNNVLRIASGIAAALIIAMGIGLTIRFGNKSEVRPECVAYVNGKCVTDEAQVMEIMEQNVADLESGVAEARNDMLDEMRELLPDIEITPEEDNEKL